MRSGLKNNPPVKLQYFTGSLPIKQFDFSKRSLAKPKNLSFKQFVSLVNPHYKWYSYLSEIADLLQDIADDKLFRLMVFMPPRHGKTELISRLFPAYYLHKHPDRWSAITSYGAELAYTLSRNARDNYTKLGGQLKQDAANVKNWETGQGGGLWAAGVGGPATGKGFHLGIIDDPIKDAVEAQSGAVQRRNNDWFSSVFWTRREPVNAVIVVQTRWGKSDLSGHILENESEEPEYWTIVHREAIKESENYNYPETCNVIKDTREIGEALSPERYPIEKLRKIKKKIRDFFWNALYQQSPIQRTGRVYHSFKGPGPASYELDLSRAEGFYHSHDFGAVNHVWGLWAKIGKKYYLIHSEKLPEGTTESRAQKIKAHFEGRKVIAGWGGAPSEKQFRSDFSRYGVSIRLPSNTDVESQIGTTNGMLDNDEMVICSDQLEVIDQLENCIRDSKEGIADKHIWHFCDMCRYFGAGIKSGGWVR